jgi:hypothetical protein
MNILPFVFESIVVDISPFSLLLPHQEAASVFTTGLTQNSFLSEESITIKLTIITVHILLSWLSPPAKFSKTTHTHLESAFEDVALRLLYALSTKEIVLKASFIGQLLVDISPLLAVCFIVYKLALEIGAISQYEESCSLSTALYEPAYEQRPVAFIHFADPMRNSSLELSLVDVIAELPCLY